VNIHPTLAAGLRRQTESGPDGWEATVSRMTLFDLAADMELGFFLSYYRNFAIPGIAATLHTSAEIQQRPLKRSYDTAIVIYELIANGLDSASGHEMIALLNRVHRLGPRPQRRDFLYVLLWPLVADDGTARHRKNHRPASGENY
jgi:hypothetical protein